MIDTTKTANQKRKEAAAARRTEKALLKTTIKPISRSVPGTNKVSNEGSSQNTQNGKLDASMASDSIAQKHNDDAS